MKYILLCVGLSVAAITEFSITNNDTIFVKKYYESGGIKEKGVKVWKLKQGKWFYYNENGFPYKIENYESGKLLKSFEIGDADERNNR